MNMPQPIIYEAGDVLKNSHTGELRTIDKNHGYEIVFVSNGGSAYLDSWTIEDIRIHWQNITKGEAEKTWGEHGFNPHIVITSSGLSYR